MFNFFKKDNEKEYGKYPCNDLLNHALWFLMRDENPNKNAIAEICYAISKANGQIKFKEELKERGLYPYKE